LRASVSRVRWRCLKGKRPTTGELGFGDFRPCFAKRLEAPQGALIEYPHIGWIAVIKLLENVLHR
jgi:hypothetical protein